jgi:hypothetical protein
MRYRRIYVLADRCGGAALYAAIPAVPNDGGVLSLVAHVDASTKSSAAAVRSPETNEPLAQFARGSQFVSD